MGLIPTPPGLMAVVVHLTPAELGTETVHYPAAAWARIAAHEGGPNRVLGRAVTLDRGILSFVRGSPSSL